MIAVGVFDASPFGAAVAFVVVDVVAAVVLVDSVAVVVVLDALCFLPPQPAAVTASTASRQASAERTAVTVASFAVRSEGIHHLGVAVADLDEAVATWRRLFGAEIVQRETVEDMGIETALLSVGGDRIELLASLGPDTPVGRFLERRGPGMHHVAFSVCDIEGELERLAASGAELIDERPRAGAFGHEVAFIHPSSAGGVLTELVSHA